MLSLVHKYTWPEKIAPFIQSVCNRTQVGFWNEQMARKHSKVLTWKMQNRASLRGMSCVQCQLGSPRQLVPDSAPEELAPRKVIVSKQWMACTRILKKGLLYYQFAGLLLIRYCNTAPGSEKYLISRSFAWNEIAGMPTRSFIASTFRRRSQGYYFSSYQNVDDFHIASLSAPLPLRCRIPCIASIQAVIV